MELGGDKYIREIIDALSLHGNQTRSALGCWKKLAKQYGVSVSGIELIAGKIL